MSVLDQLNLFFIHKKWLNWTQIFHNSKNCDFFMTQFCFFFIALLKIIIIKGFWKVRTTTRDAIITFTQLIFTAHYYNCMYMMMIIAVAWCQKITNLQKKKIIKDCDFSSLPFISSLIFVVYWHVYWMFEVIYLIFYLFWLYLNLIIYNNKRTVNNNMMWQVDEGVQETKFVHGLYLYTKQCNNIITVEIVLIKIIEIWVIY